MTTYVVDASVAAKWFFNEPHTQEALQLRNVPGTLLAPDLMLIEVAQVFWKRVGRGDLSQNDASLRLQELGRLPLKWRATSPLLGPALDIASTFGRSVYDSVYVALAVRDDATLVTADLRLFNALRPTPLSSHVCWIEDLPA